MVVVAPFVVGEVAAFLEVHREGEAGSLLGGAVVLASLAVGVVASQGARRGDVVGSAEEEVRIGTSKNGVPGVIIICQFQVFRVQKSQLHSWLAFIELNGIIKHRLNWVLLDVVSRTLYRPDSRGRARWYISLESTAAF